MHTIHPSLHNGGPVNDPAQTVDADGTTVMVPGFENRRYLRITWPSAATEPVYLRLHPTEPAVVGSGIVLYPGDSYEISYWNMYAGPIRAVTEEVAENIPMWHEGR